MKSSSITCRAAVAAAIMITAALSSCRSGDDLVQETLPVESAAVDLMGSQTARVRGICCDVMVRHLDGTWWERLGSSRVYRRGSVRPLMRRTPPLTAFIVILKNTVNAPIRLEKAHILGAGLRREALTAGQIRARFRSPAYAWLDFGRMLSFRRLLVEPESFTAIDPDRDTIETRLDFIPPQDHVIGIIAFDRIPVEIRRYRLGFSIAAMGSLREVSVEFARNEYRGAPRKKKKEIEDYDE